MSVIDKERVAAVAKLQALGYAFTLADGWTASSDAHTHAGAIAEADAMHGLLMRRADTLEGCTEGSSEEAELSLITDAIEAYEAKRWPDGKDPGGKG